MLAPLIGLDNVLPRRLYADAPGAASPWRRAMNAMKMTRRHMLALACAAAQALAWPATAQVVAWSADDEARYRAVRAAFNEYADLSDRDFSARMEALFRTLDSNPDAPVVIAEVTRRLPAYADAPPTRVKREMNALFRKASQHFATAQPPRRE